MNIKVASSVILARRESLAKLLEKHRYLPLAEVCDRLGISQATARRDLRVLAREKKVTRTYGGALGTFDATFASFADHRAIDREPVAGLRAVTNSLPVAEMLGRCPEVEVHLLGGRFLQRQSLLLGPDTRRFARLWKFDLVFLGAEGLSKGGIWASKPEVAIFQKALIAQSKQVIVCAHAAKLDRETGVFLTPWTPKLQLVTDVSPAQRAYHGLPA